MCGPVGPMTGLQNSAESTRFYRGTSSYVGLWRWRGVGGLGERAAQQAEGIEVQTEGLSHSWA